MIEDPSIRRKNKITRYEIEGRCFREKYACDFEKFKARVKAMENEENFAWEDDLVDWEFAVINLNRTSNSSREITLNETALQGDHNVNVIIGDKRWK